MNFYCRLLRSGLLSNKQYLPILQFSFSAIVIIKPHFCLIKYPLTYFDNFLLLNVFTISAAASLLSLYGVCV
jgi:hypothetical protein